MSAQTSNKEEKAPPKEPDKPTFAKAHDFLRAKVLPEHAREACSQAAKLLGILLVSFVASRKLHEH